MALVSKEILRDTHRNFWEDKISENEGVISCLVVATNGMYELGKTGDDVERLLKHVVRVVHFGAAVIIRLEATTSVKTKEIP